MEVVSMTAQNMDYPKHVSDLFSTFSKILAAEIAKELGPELKKLHATESAPLANVKMQQFTSTPHGSLWSLTELAADSGIKKGTWYKWINQRKLPAVRLGRTVRVRDDDYQKFIQRSVRRDIPGCT